MSRGVPVSESVPAEVAALMVQRYDEVGDLRLVAEEFCATYYAVRLVMRDAGVLRPRGHGFFSLPPRLQRQVDVWAAARGVSSREALRRLVQAGLDAGRG